MGSQRHLPKPWGCGSLKLLHALDPIHSRPECSRREGSSAHFRHLVSDGPYFLPGQIRSSLLFSLLLPFPLFALTIGQKDVLLISLTACLFLVAYPVGKGIPRDRRKSR